LTWFVLYLTVICYSLLVILYWLSEQALEHVEFFMLRRKQKNFISGKANFAVGCGQSGEKFNED